MLLAKGRTAEAEAVAARYLLPSPTLAEAPQAGAKGRFAAVASLFGPGQRFATPLLWLASFAGLLLVYGVSTWLPELMRASGYSLSSSVTFLMVINAGGIVGMLVAGRIADRFGAVRISAIWFLLTACGAFLLRAELPLGLAYVIVFVTGIWLFSRAGDGLRLRPVRLHGPPSAPPASAGSPASGAPAPSSGRGWEAPSSPAETRPSASPRSPWPRCSEPSRSRWCHSSGAAAAPRPTREYPRPHREQRAPGRAFLVTRRERSSPSTRVFLLPTHYS